MRSKKEIDLIYKHEHKDFKTKLNGIKCVMFFKEGKGSVLCPVKDLPDFEYEKMLKYAQTMEEK